MRVSSFTQSQSSHQAPPDHQQVRPQPRGSSHFQKVIQDSHGALRMKTHPSLLDGGVFIPHFYKNLALVAPRSARLPSQNNILYSLLRPVNRSHIHDFIPRLPANSHRPCARIKFNIPKNLSLHQDRLFAFMAERLKSLHVSDRKIKALYQKLHKNLHQPTLKFKKPLQIESFKREQFNATCPKKVSFWDRFKVFVLNTFSWPYNLFKLFLSLFKR